MKKIFVSILSLMISTWLIGQGINFEQGTYAQALAKAKQENKVLFIDGYADWCSPCLQMSATTFMDEHVGNFFAENMVALKVNVEKGEGPDLKRKLGITGLPGYVFLDGEGIVVYRALGKMDVEPFLEECRLAMYFAKDSNSIGRMTIRYETEKNDEQFLRLYLDRLHQGEGKGYVEVLEHFLDIQTVIADSSKEMVLLLAAHKNEIIFGGKADQIIEENLGSDPWKRWVRKDIRQIYQDMGIRQMERTTEFAIEKKDSAMLNHALKRAAEEGLNTDNSFRRKTYKYFYSQTNEGEIYKEIAAKDMEEMISKLDVEKFRTDYLQWREDLRNGVPKAKGTRPYAIKYSSLLLQEVNTYSQFVTSEEDKANVIRWSEIAYTIRPEDPQIISFYANILYMYGDQKKALKVKSEAIKYLDDSKEPISGAEDIRSQFEAMRQGLTLKSN